VSERSHRRLVVLQVLVLALLVTLLGRLWYLQVVTGEEYKVAATDNRVREVVTPAVRGLILDDQGRPFVGNRTSLVVTVDRNVLAKQDDEGVAVLGRLAAVLGTTEQSIRDRIALCGTPGAQKPPVCWNGSPFQPVPVARDVPTDLALRIMEQREEFPGIDADLEAVRQYGAPEGANAAHLLGYLGPVSDDEVAASATTDSILRRSDLVGRDGLEKQYDQVLRGTPGVKSLAVDRSGVVTGTVSEVPSTPGNYLVTSIDAKVQAVAEKALLDQITAARAGETYKGPYVADSGAVVVLDVRTGRLVAMASYPSYDPAVWVGGISNDEYAALTSKESGTPLISRATAGEFAPASTFKVVSTSAVAKAGYRLDGGWPCTADYKVGNRTFKNFESKGFGKISVARALEVSCNTVFYNFGYDMWLKDGGNRPNASTNDFIVNEALGFGLGAKTGVDLPSERAGRVVTRADRQETWESNKDQWCADAKDPSLSAYVRAVRQENCIDGGKYRAGDAVNVAIGQGETLVTPLQMARVYAAIANGGTLWQPQVAKAVVSPDGTVVEEFQPKVAGTLPTDPATIAYLQKSLRGVAQNGTGAGVFGDFPIEVSAKTGSGQVTGKQDTSWFASYAPSSNPQYAVIMTISQGGTGAGTSAPGVKKIYEALFGVTNGVVDPNTSVLPGGQLPTSLPTVRADGTLAQPAPAQPAPAPVTPAPVSFATTATASPASYRVGDRR